MPSNTVRRKTEGVPAAWTQKRSLRGELKQFTREKIVTAALEAFADNGYRGTTVERIVELAGTTAPTFYRHFSSKAELLGPLRAFLVEEVSAVVYRLDTPNTRTVAEVRAWVEDYWLMWRRLKRLCAAHWEATTVDEDFAADTFLTSLRIAGGLTDYIEAVPEPQREKFHLRLAISLSMLERMVHHAGLDRDETRAKVMLDEFAEILWLALFSPSRDISAEI
ncbi:MAG: TetR/AcrR family transcriptional regulator [Sphingobium sp.]